MTLERVRVLGVDPSLTRTGWAIVDEWGACLRSGVIVPLNPKASARARGICIAYQLAQKLPSLGPTDIAVEAPIVYGQPNITVKLCQLNGAIGMGIGVQTLQRQTILDLNISEWRPAVGFHFKAIKGEDTHKRTERLKQEILAHAEKRWPGVTFGSADAAEAALIALRGLMHVTGLHPIALPVRKPRKKGVRKPRK